MKRNTLLIVLLLYGVLAMAQNKITITIKDSKTLFALSGAHYTYGAHSGVSSEDGTLTLLKQKGVSLEITHVGYQTLLVSNFSLTDNSVITMKRATTLLLPVSVMALHNDKEYATNLSFGYQDMLSHDAGKVLSAISGVSTIQKSGSYAFDPVVRGFKYDQLNIIMGNAQSAMAACPNRMDPPTSQVTPNMVDEVQVLKGPHALRFGVGLGATLRFKEASPVFSEKQAFFGRASALYNTNGNEKKTEVLLGHRTKNTELKLFGALSSGDDFISGSGKTMPGDYEKHSFGLQFASKLSSNQEVILSATRNYARDVDFAALPMDLRQDDTWLFNVKHNIYLNGGSLKKVNTELYGTFVDHLMDNRLRVQTTTDAVTEAVTKVFGARVEGEWNIAKGVLFSGVDVSKKMAAGERTRTMLTGMMAGTAFDDNVWQDAHVTKSSLFAEFNKVQGDWKYVVSARLEYNQAGADDLDPGFQAVYKTADESQLNPSISMGAIRTVNKVHKFGAWLARAQRSADITERYINLFPVGLDPYEMLGNPNLSPEVNHQLDLSYAYTKKNYQIKIEGFGALISDYIASTINPNLTKRLKMSPGVRQFANVDDVLLAGGEVSYLQNINRYVSHDLKLAYVFAEDRSDHSAMPEIPPVELSYQIKGNLLKGKLQPMLKFNYVAEQGRVSSEFGESKFPAYHTLDVSVRYKMLDALQLTAGVENIQDVEYYRPLTRAAKATGNPIYAPGRSVYFSVNYSF